MHGQSGSHMPAKSTVERPESASRGAGSHEQAQDNDKIWTELGVKLKELCFSNRQSPPPSQAQFLNVYPGTAEHLQLQAEVPQVTVDMEPISSSETRWKASSQQAMSLSSSIGPSDIRESFSGSLGRSEIRGSLGSIRESLSGSLGRSEISLGWSPGIRSSSLASSSSAVGLYGTGRTEFIGMRTNRIDSGGSESLFEMRPPSSGTALHGTGHGVRHEPDAVRPFAAGLGPRGDASSSSATTAMGLSKGMRSSGSDASSSPWHSTGSSIRAAPRHSQEPLGLQPSSPSCPDFGSHKQVTIQSAFEPRVVVQSPLTPPRSSCPEVPMPKPAPQSPQSLRSSCPEVPMPKPGPQSPQSLQPTRDNMGMRLLLGFSEDSRNEETYIPLNMADPVHLCLVKSLIAEADQVSSRHTIVGQQQHTYHASSFAHTMHRRGLEHPPFCRQQAATSCSSKQVCARCSKVIVLLWWFRFCSGFGGCGPPPHQSGPPPDRLQVPQVEVLGSKTAQNWAENAVVYHLGYIGCVFLGPYALEPA